MISPGWIITLFIITEILVWDIIKTGFKTVRHCATAKSYSKAITQNNITIPYEDFQTEVYNKLQNKEEKKDGSK